MGLCEHIPESEMSLICTSNAYLLDTREKKNEGRRGQSLGRRAATEVIALHSTTRPSAAVRLCQSSMNKRVCVLKLTNYIFGSVPLAKLNFLLLG